MAGSFQPAKLDVDSSILDSKLSIVSSEQDEIDSMFSQMNQAPKIETLVPETEYASVTVCPKPGLCVKTKNSKGQKFFLNLCRVDQVPAPTPIKEEELERMIAEEDYTNLWRVPMSIGAPRKEKDKSGAECLAADVAINSDWFNDVMEPSQMFTAFVITVAMEGLGDKHDEARLDRDTWTVLKNKRYLGDKVPPHNIQKRASVGIKPMKNDNISKINDAKSSENVTSSKKREPLYKIEKNRVVNATEMTASVYLPGVFTRNQITLNLGEDRILLETKTGNYELDIFLPIKMNSTKSQAWFLSDTNILNVKIPILA